MGNECGRDRGTEGRWGEGREGGREGGRDLDRGSERGRVFREEEIQRKSMSQMMEGEPDRGFSL